MKATHDLDRLDFLLVLEAVLAHKTITRAASHLGVSQSALSHALVRLRERFGDPLFVRSGGVMKPTPLVAGIVSPLEKSLALIRNDILGATGFEPATARRVFRVCVNEIGAMLLVPKILRLLSERAPLATLAPLDVAPPDIAASLESGAIDLAVGHFPDLKSTLFQQRLLARRYRAIVSASHPTVRSRMTARQFHQTPLVLCTRSTEVNRWLERHFAEAGLPLPVALQTPHIMAVGSIVAATGWLAFVSEDLVEPMKAVAGVREVDVPVSVPTFEVKQYWHRQYKDDRANRFLRSVAYDALHE